MLATSLIRIAIISVLLILSQAFVFDLIHISGFGNIMVYPLILMLVPIRVPNVVVLLIGFLVGYLIDFMLGTGGLHAASMTFMAFVRSAALNLNNTSDSEDKTIGLIDLGFQKFFGFLILLVFAHQFAYYLIEKFSFTGLLYTFNRILTGTLLSTISILLIAVIFVPRKNKKGA